MNKSKTILTAVATTLVAVTAFATPVTITNASFESTTVTENSTSSTVTGWTGASGIFNTGASTRYYNDPDFVDAGTTGGARGTMTGKNFAFFSGDGAATISQVLSATLQANTQYTLSVALGHRTVDSGNGTIAPLVTLEMLAGSISLATASYDINSGIWVSGADIWSDGILNFDSNSTPSLIGQTLTIKINKAANTPAAPASGYMDIDNVRLDASPSAVPEPSTYGVVGAASLAVAAMMRRRRKIVG